MTTLRIATRKSPLALWQSEHVAAQLRVAHPRLVVELVPMTHPRRRSAGSLAGGDRRQGPVPQGTGTGDAARRRRLRRAFAQGRADGAGAGLRAAGDPGARGPRRCLRQQPLRHAAMHCRRARASAPRRCAGRRSCARAAPDLRAGRPARQRQYPPGQTRRRRLRRDRAGLRGPAAPGPGCAHPHVSMRRSGCRRPRRARSRSNAATTTRHARAVRGARRPHRRAPAWKPSAR